MAASGARIRQARELAGVTNQFLAIKLGAGKGTVSRWESGATSPSIEQYLELGRLLNARASWLMAIEVVDHVKPDPIAEAIALLQDELDRKIKKLK
jgi:transcriptional regulator with XRE-family HTH domain